LAEIYVKSWGRAVSWENLKDAYRTRLGNLTAKSVLVLIVDEANAEGLAFVGLARVATLTEINRRTTLRIVQVFGEIDLVMRTEAILKGKALPAFQVNLAKLGLDLTAEFGAAYRGASRKCLRDMGSGVSETRRSVSETRGSVSETLPPHPLIGRSPLLPFVSSTPVVPASGDVSFHDLAIERGTDQVASALNIAEEQRRKRRLIQSAIRRAAEKGDPPATIALDMIAAVREQDELHLRRQLKFKFGLQKFLGEGIWRDRNRWAWDPAEMRLQAEARVGSQR
jgi:hypothetical protein